MDADAGTKVPAAAVVPVGRPSGARASDERTTMTEPGRLPSWGSVLAVVAHPDDESFGLGALLAAFADRGARISVLCLTRGESSTLPATGADLMQVRAAELAAAADVLGLHDVTMLDFPDGALAAVGAQELDAAVTAAAEAVAADGLIGFDPTGVTGHPDHAAATSAALRAADALDLPVLGWTLPQEIATRLQDELGGRFDGHPPGEIDLVLEVDRKRQLTAINCHASQAVPGSVLWRRLQLLADREYLRWLRGRRGR
jgi:LmbE family N-acetylglucosaminyl deacetylase